MNALKIIGKGIAKVIMVSCIICYMMTFPWGIGQGIEMIESTLNW